MLRVRFFLLIVAASLAAPAAGQNVLQVTKSASNSPTAGTNHVWTIEVLNPDSTTAAANVVLTDNIPANTSFVSFVQTSGPSFTCTTPPVGAISGQISCSLASLAPYPAGVANFTMTVHIDPLASDPITNTANVSTTTPDDPSDNTSSHTVFPQNLADIEVIKTGATTVPAGGTATYLVTVRNNGPSAARDVALEDSQNVIWVTFVSWRQLDGPGFACALPVPGNYGIVYCVTPVMPAGSSATFEFVARVNSDVPPGSSFVNHVQANLTGFDPIANNVDEVQTTVTSSSDIQVTKNGPVSAVAGLPIVYDITVRNNGPSDADFGFTDVLPAGTTFESVQTDRTFFNCATPAVGATGTVTCGIDGTIDPAGTVVNVRLTLRVDPNVAQGTSIANTAQTGGAGIGFSDPNSTNNSSTSLATIFTTGDLMVTKFPAAATVAPGGDITYTMTLANNGPSDVNSVTLTDVIPTGTTFVSFADLSGSFTCTTPSPGGTGTVSCSTATVYVGGTANFTLVVRTNTSVSGGSNISNTATVSSPASDPSSGNNSATANVTVMAPDLTLAKTDTPDPVSAGSNITYGLVFSNEGSSGANAVSLTDTLPANTTFVALSQPSGPAFACSTPAVGATGTITCTNAFVAAGASGEIRIVARVNPGTPNGTVITNTANISTTDAEPDTADNSATTTSTVAVAADIAVTKSGPATVSSTGMLTYNLAITNNGPADAMSVVLSDPTPPSTTFQSFAQTSGPAFTLSTPAVGGTGTVSASAATLAAGATASFTLVLQANGAPAGSTITNTANGTTTTTDANGSNNSASVNTSVAAPDLVLTKTDAPDPVQPGNDITYNLTLTNSGSAAANSVSLNDNIPANTTFVSLAQTSGAGFTCTTPSLGGTGAVTCTIASLNAAGSATFTLIVRTAAGLPSGTTITNTASATTTDTDANIANNSATTTTGVSAIADVAITKTGPATLTPGTTGTWVLTVTNNGPGDAQNVNFADTLPAGTTFTSLTQTSGASFTCTTPAAGATGTVNCSIGTLAAGASAAFNLSFGVSSAAAGGSTISNTATVSSAATDPNLSNNSATASGTVASAPDIAVTKTDTPDPVVDGNNITYTINVANNGNASAANVTLNDSIPANTRFVSLTTPAGWTATTPPVGGTGTVSASIASLGAGASGSFTLVVSVNGGVASGTIITNSASVATTSSDANPANNSATTTTTVSAVVSSSADLSVTKTANAAAVPPGSNITYTMTVANSGPDTATTVTLTDNLPAGVTFVSAASNQGSCSGTSVVTCAIGTLDSGETATVTIVIRSSTVGVITNTASVTSDLTDPASGNNTSSVAVNVTAAAIPALDPTALLLLAMTLAVAGTMLLRFRS